MRFYPRAKFNSLLGGIIRRRQTERRRMTCRKEKLPKPEGSSGVTVADDGKRSVCAISHTERIEGLVMKQASIQENSAIIIVDIRRDSYITELFGGIITAQELLMSHAS